MTVHDTKMAVEIMQHFINGGEVEYKKHDENDTMWQVHTHPNWDWNEHVYRIKPKVMKITEEEKKKMERIWVKVKLTGEIYGFPLNTEINKEIKKDHYILNFNTMEWKDWSQDAERLRHHYNGGQS